MRSKTSCWSFIFQFNSFKVGTIEVFSCNLYDLGCGNNTGWVTSYGDIPNNFGFIQERLEKISLLHHVGFIEQLPSDWVNIMFEKKLANSKNVQDFMSNCIDLAEPLSRRRAECIWIQVDSASERSCKVLNNYSINCPIYLPVPG